MRIQHNIMAMNSYRNYTNNAGKLSGNLEKLSSGYKINRAGDDAAGLAISEKMRAQIAGLTAAQDNVKDGVSLVKTAEGALQEVQDMLNRMMTLAEKSANGTYDDNVDRANLQKEVASLKTEIDRIADSANFNGINLLDGTQEPAGAAKTAGTTSVTAAATIDFTGLTGKDLIGGSITIGGKTYAFAGGATASAGSVSGSTILLQKGTSAAGIAALVNTAAASGTAIQVAAKVEGASKSETLTWTAAVSGSTSVVLSASKKGSIRATDYANFTLNAGLQLQVGDTSDSFNQMRVGIADMHADKLQLNMVNVGDQTSATDSIDYIKAAINQVSANRGDLGAIQNRLNHTLNNLSVMTENIQDAESTIRDTDIADEMTTYTKNNILLQSAQAMLAQANAVPQGVLQLLQ